MRATDNNGVLNYIYDCYISIPRFKNPEYYDPYLRDTSLIPMRIIPDISDSKGAQYSDEPIFGRSSPMKTYSHSENRTISWSATFIVCRELDPLINLSYLRAIQSAVYPRVENIGSAPYAPPPVCFLSCGKLLDDDSGVCAVLRSYTVKYPTDVAWDEATKIPYKFSVDMSWDVVYKSDNLPGQNKILGSNYCSLSQMNRDGKCRNE